jgi:hypothetical protein
MFQKKRFLALYLLEGQTTIRVLSENISFSVYWRKLSLAFSPDPPSTL